MPKGGRPLSRQGFMKIIVWILRICVFIALFGLALKNSGAVDLRFFFDRMTTVPLSFVVLVSFTLGVLIGVTVGGSHADGAAAGNRPSAPVCCGSRTLPDGISIVEIELWWLLALPLFFALGWIAARVDIRQRGANRVRCRVPISGPELPAQRAAGQGDRGFHRSGPGGSRNHRAALRPRQPISPPRRNRSRHPHASRTWSSASGSAD